MKFEKARIYPGTTPMNSPIPTPLSALKECQDHWKKVTGSMAKNIHFKGTPPSISQKM